MVFTRCSVFRYVLDGIEWLLVYPLYDNGHRSFGLEQGKIAYYNKIYAVTISFPAYGCYACCVPNLWLARFIFI